MRVLLIGNFFPVQDKTQQYCQDLAQQLETRGCEVIRVSRFRSRPLRFFDMAVAPWRLRAAYDVAQVDVFSGPSFLWAEAAALSLQMAGKPFVLTLHGGALPQFARRYPRRVARVFRKAAAVTAPSAYLAEAMRPFRPDIRVIPNALDLSKYLFRHRNTVTPRLVWLRAFHRIYAPEVAIQALARLGEDYPAAHLTMVGPDKDGSLARSRALAADLGVSDRVSLVPGVPKREVPEILAGADIFVNTTTVDNTPVSVIEAMACGLCVVSTDAGGVPHLVREGEEALLVPVGDSAAMTEAVERLLKQSELAARLSLKGRRKVERFDWGRVLPQWEQLLREVARTSAAIPQDDRILE